MVFHLNVFHTSSIISLNIIHYRQRNRHCGYHLFSDDARIEYYRQICRPQKYILTSECITQCSLLLFQKIHYLPACSTTLERCNSAEAFTCGDGQCIQLSSKCNRECDCSDCSDEKNCRKLNNISESSSLSVSYSANPCFIIWSTFPFNVLAIIQLLLKTTYWKKLRNYKLLF